MTVAATSLDAYRTHREGNLGKQSATVFAFIALHPDCSRQEIAVGSGVAINAVCGRVDELLKVGSIEVSGVKRCSVTGSTVNALRVAPIQRPLFAA